jgi:hypothetical protein
MVFVATKVQISRRREESESGLDPNLARATHTPRCRLSWPGGRVARVFPGEHRRISLSLSHHKEVAGVAG